MSDLATVLQEHRKISCDALLEHCANEVLRRLKNFAPYRRTGLGTTRLLQVQLEMLSITGGSLSLFSPAHLEDDAAAVAVVCPALERLGFSKEAAWIRGRLETSRSILRQETFVFEEPDFLGKFYVLNSPKFFIDNKHSPKKAGK